MQSMLFLQHPDTGELDRVINISLLSTACPHNENPEWTRAHCGWSDVTIHMKFSEFAAKVQELIAQNYKASVEGAAFWHNKRQKDTEEMMERVMGKHG